MAVTAQAIPLMLMSALLGAGITSDHDWGDDFAAYIMQARSVVEGNVSEFVIANRFIIQQSAHPLGPVTYPWGFPVLIAPAYKLFGLNMVALKGINLVCFVIFLALLWWGWRRHHSAPWRFVLVCLFGLNPVFQSFMNQILSDIPFLLTSTLSVILMGRIAIERRRYLSSVADHVLLGVLMAISFFIRSNGILLVATLAIMQSMAAIQKIVTEQGMVSQEWTILGGSESGDGHKASLAKRLAVDASPYVVFTLAVVGWRTVFPDESTSHFAAFNRLSASLVRANVHYYIDLPALFFSGVSHETVIYGATIPFAIAGMFQRRHSDYHVMIYGLLTVLLFVMWPDTQGLRFLFPLLPFYISFVLTGLGGGPDTLHWKRGKLWYLVRICPVILVLLDFTRVSVTNAYENMTGRLPVRAGPYLATSQEAFAFIKRETEATSIVVSFKPRAMRLYTDRLSMTAGTVTEVRRGDYLCVYLRETFNQVTQDDISKLLGEGWITPLFENADFRIYRIRQPRESRQEDALLS